MTPPNGPRRRDLRRAARGEPGGTGRRRGSQPAWLHERVNDPCGTPNKDPFWETQPFERRGNFKIFERDGVWYAYDVQYNAWWHFASQEEAHARADGGSVDVWA